MNVTSFIFFHDKLFFFSFSSQTDNALFFSTFCEWLMRKTSIFILCKFILEFLILKSMQILIFILIWLDFVLFGRPKSKFLKKEKYIPTELSPLLKKNQNVCVLDENSSRYPAPTECDSILLCLTVYWIIDEEDVNIFSRLFNFWIPLTQIDSGVYFQLNLTIPSWKSTT